VTAELQDGVMKTRMQPVGDAWRKLPRIVRDVSQELGKKIRLVQEGEDTELDRQVLELIKDPLTHMIRNSCDHGLETPESGWPPARAKPARESCPPITKAARSS
jgi:two-component system chemotaxis sensor kinase CheA